MWSFRLPASPDCPDSVSFEFSATTTVGEGYNDAGGPSSASSGDCSSPILERSQKLSRRSSEAEAKVLSAVRF